MKNINDTETSIFHYINKASIDLFAFFDSLLSSEEFNINTYEWLLLSHIIKVPGKSQKWYGDNILKDKIFVMRLIDNLEKKKLIKRKIDVKDRRQKLLFFTKDGEKIIKKTFSLIKNEYDSLFSEIDEKHINITISVLKNLIEKIDLRSKNIS
jgi:DNA-binding MarR family transcriptional regulator